MGPNVTDADRDCSLDQTTVHELLFHGRRRRVVAAVVEADVPVPPVELAAMVAAAERGVRAEQVDEGTRRSVRLALEQKHLPKLVAACVVRERPGGYEAGENAEALAAVMDATAAEL